MSWVTDTLDALYKLIEFGDFVDQGQAALLLRRGIAQKREIRYAGEELEKILSEEKKVEKECGGKLKFIIPFTNPPKMPPGYGRKFILGTPRHPKRYEKDVNLRPGFYPKIPIYEKIYMDHNQDRRLVSKVEDLVGVPMKGGGNVSYGFVMIVRIFDYYTAYTQGDDYEELIRGKASTISKSFAGNLTSEQWSNPDSHKRISDQTLDELNKFTVKRWGVEVKEFSLNPVIINPFILVNYSSDSGMNALTDAVISTLPIKTQNQ